MSAVLIATLGDSPIVVTAMAHALREQRGISVAAVEVIYPGADQGRLIDLGYDLIAEHLRPWCAVNGHALPFDDAHDTTAMFSVLRRLADLLDHHERAGDQVYLSLAGGRKNIAALTALVSQFYPCIQGLFHLIDRREQEQDRRNFAGISALMDLTAPRRREKLAPPQADLILVDLPYRPFAQAVALRQYLAAAEQGAPAPIALSAEAEEFFSSIFQPGRATELLDVFLSQTACEQLDKLPPGSRQRAEFLKCFRQMQDPDALRGHMHGVFGAPGRTLHFFKRRRTRERPFFYTRPQPLHLPDADIREAIICGLAQEEGDGSYTPDAAWLLQHAGPEPYRHINALESDRAVLLAPLGDSPMVVTQTAALLREREGINIDAIRLIYPEGYVPARNGAALLRELCRRQRIDCADAPVRGLHDLASRADCETYAQALLAAIAELREQHPHVQLLLSLSGGRKGMSALALFAAQTAGIARVYHTLIRDPELEAQIEHECSLSELRRQPAPQQIRRLWLEAYPRDAFVLVAVPVIPLARQPADQ